MDKLKILSYNVCGLKNKVRDSYFLEFLSSFDVIILLETFIIEKDRDFINKNLKNFKLHFILAGRAAVFGRPRGGLIFLINLQSPCAKNLEFFETQNLFFIQCKNVGNLREPVNILPAYLNYNNWDTEFNSILDFLSQNILNNLIIIGDLNGRIGSEQNFPEGIIELTNNRLNGRRQSKDGEVNQKGQKLLSLFENNGLVILNGRAVGDTEGDFTFVGTAGSSVIDLAAVSVDCLPFIHDFKVLTFPGSDHLPIGLDLKLGITVAGDGGVSGGEGALLPLLPRLKWTSTDNSHYRDKMNITMLDYKLCENNETNVRELTNCILKAAHHTLVINNPKSFVKKEVWFDGECFSVRKKVFKLLNFYRKYNQTEVKRKYLEQCKKYKLLCKTKKLSHYNTLIDKLKQSKDSKECWQAINSFKGRTDKRVGNIPPDAWLTHFKALLNPPSLSDNIHYAEMFLEDEILDQDFNMSELKVVLKRVKEGKAPGLDRVPYEFYKNAPDSFLKHLLTFYNSIYSRGEVPESFKKSIVFPLHKKGDVQDVKNYRGLSFIDCVGKIFTSLLNNRLTLWLENKSIITECQAGFRKGYSTVDNIFNLTSIAHLKLSENKGKLYCFFVDFSSAFDTILRKAMIYKMACTGVSSKFLNVLKSYYEGTSAVVWSKDGVTDSFDTTMGLRQGCVLSPTMFSLFINDLPGALEGGCNFGGEKVNVLMYADDIVLMSPTATGLQHMIKNLEVYCKTWNLQVNLSKSKIMVVRNGGKLARNDKWWYNGERIQVVNEYKYLGVIITSNLSWEKHFKEKVKSAKLAINSVWSKFLDSRKVPLSSKLMCYNSIIKSIVCYCSQVWGFNASNTVESAQTCFIKKLFRLPQNTPNYVLYLETYFSKIYFHTALININYLIKLLSLPAHRLPNVLVKQLINKNLYCCKYWKALGRSRNVEVNFSLTGDGGSIVELQSQLIAVLEGEREAWRASCEGRARTSQYHQQYLNLDFDLGGRTLLTDNNDQTLISWAIKARAELLNLNYKPWLPGNNHFCSICNLCEIESSFHFIAKCPIFKDLRRNYFGKQQLEINEYYEFLNGKDWLVLTSYLKLAWNKRWALIQEFNY